MRCTIDKIGRPRRPHSHIGIFTAQTSLFDQMNFSQTSLLKAVFKMLEHEYTVDFLLNIN